MLSEILCGIYLTDKGCLTETFEVLVKQHKSSQKWHSCFVWILVFIVSILHICIYIRLGIMNTVNTYIVHCILSLDFPGVQTKCIVWMYEGISVYQYQHMHTIYSNIGTEYFLSMVPISIVNSTRNQKYAFPYQSLQMISLILFAFLRIILNTFNLCRNPKN